MSIHNKRLVLAGLLNFVLDGASITNAGGSVNSSSTVKPDGTTPTDWVNFSPVVKAAFSVEDKKQDVIAGVAAEGYRRVDVLRSQVVHDAKITITDWNENCLRAFFRCAAITDGTALAFGSTTSGLRGWWQLIGVAQNGATVQTIEFYGEVTIKAIDYDNKHAQPEIMIEIIHSSLNTLKSALTAAA